MTPNFRGEMGVRFVGGCCGGPISLVPDPANEGASRVLKEDCGSLYSPHRLTEKESNYYDETSVLRTSPHLLPRGVCW